MVGWRFDVEILCPICGAENLKFSDPTCTKSRETLNEKYFIILKFMELEYNIKKLEKRMDEENGQ